MTDKELLQAKADVEECYRRRAMRAGLEETLPVGRPMTDAEIDDLSKRLGDWEPANGFGSRGTKRSREVIDMTIEEMEARSEKPMHSAGGEGGGAWGCCQCHWRCSCA